MTPEPFDEEHNVTEAHEGGSLLDEELADSTVSSDAQAEEPACVLEEEYHLEEVTQDHRVLQLQKLRSQVVGDNELSLPSETITIDPVGPALIVCPNCNHEEVRGQRFCSQCNARMPQIVLIEQKYNPGSIDGAARKYYDAIQNFHSGSTTLDEFVEFLNAGLDRVRSHAEHMAELASDGVMNEWLPEASALIDNATQLWQDSVESMLIRIDDIQIEHEEEEADLEDLSDEELDAHEPITPLEEKVRAIDFTHELESIFRSNDMMLEYLRILDASVKSETAVGGMQF